MYSGSFSVTFTGYEWKRPAAQLGLQSFTFATPVPVAFEKLHSDQVKCSRDSEPSQVIGMELGRFSGVLPGQCRTVTVGTFATQQYDMTERRDENPDDRALWPVRNERISLDSRII